jgi:hypothetical protein
MLLLHKSPVLTGSFFLTCIEICFNQVLWDQQQNFISLEYIWAISLQLFNMSLYDTLSVQTEDYFDFYKPSSHIKRILKNHAHLYNYIYIYPKMFNLNFILRVFIQYNDS